MPRLQRLFLRGARPGLDLAPLAGHRNLEISFRKGQHVRNRRALNRSVRIRGL